VFYTGCRFDGEWDTGRLCVTACPGGEYRQGTSCNPMDGPGTTASLWEVLFRFTSDD